MKLGCCEIYCVGMLLSHVNVGFAGFVIFYHLFVLGRL
jgi:hypothetical protein